MTNSSVVIIALDVGDRRIGVARADSSIAIPVVVGTIERDGSEVKKVQQIMADNDATDLVIGYPRNQAGEPTLQTKAVEAFAAELTSVGLKSKFQDESLTSVLAEKELIRRNKPYKKGDVDALAACIIAEDYLREHYS